MVGTRVSHYRVVAPLGEGGMGVVYLAEDEQLGRKVALKFITPAVAGDPAARARLIREARTAGAVDHPNVATVYEAGEWDGQLFVAMAYYPGETLKARIARGPLPVAEAAAHAEQIASGLAAAHAANIVHRDLKPANIILTAGGGLKILDFGLAKSFGSCADTTIDLTMPGSVSGTVAYMAPEQASGAEVDARADMWAFGVVLFEMLTGRTPFARESVAATLSALMTGAPPPLRASRPDAPRELEQLVERALVRDREARTLTAAEAVAALRALRDAAGSPAGPRLSRRAMIAAVVAVAVAAVAIVPWAVRQSRQRWVQGTAIPEIRRMSGSQNAAALDLAIQAEKYVPGHPELARLWPAISRRLTIESEPADAHVEYVEYASRGTWRSAGRTPLRDVRLPLGWLHVRVTKPGFETAEDVVANFGGQGAVSRADFPLVPAGSGPPGMVRAAGASSFEMYVLGLELPPAELNAFWIDRHEVTNREFKAFVDAGGYSRQEFWREPFARDGAELSWAEALTLFRDATGRPGPAGWALGRYPEGEDDLPVRGISWFEAAAYAAFAGKSLPTIYHWNRVATQPLVGFVIPFATFNARTPVRADSSAALHRFGALNLAGNVKEWTFNEAGGGRRYILGGGYDEPPYMFADTDARSPFERSPNMGFRCVKYDPGDGTLAALSGIVSGPSRDYRRENPVADEIFAAYARLYSYDRTELNAVSERVDDSDPDWRRETVTFDAAYGKERMIAHLFLPKIGGPPYQAVVFMPPANAWSLRSSDRMPVHPAAAAVLRSGRALVLPVYKGTLERGSDEMASDHRRGSNAWRDEVIAAAKDFSRTLDYLAARPDIDSSRLAYLGVSRGAALAPMLLAEEQRIRAAVQWLPGVYLERVPPEVDAINFLPRTTAPTLALSGRYDYNFPDETSSKPYFDLLGAPAADKKRVVYDTGHNLPFNEGIRETLDWFDRFLGPVK